MAMKKWVVGSPDRDVAKRISEECDIDPFAALIACGRGITDPSELELVLSDEPLLCDPMELADIKLAADFINEAINQNVHIAVFGDYDCDGVVSTALMYDYLMSRGAVVTPYIPDRVAEGYGMNKSAIDKLKQEGIGLIITVDNGISCYEEIEYAKSLGIDVVVTDHHIPPERLPQAVAVVDPHRADCPSQFKEICGAEVAFKLVCVLDDKEPEQMLPRYADILAVATVGDVMPLVNENRGIVREGIRKIKYSPCAGIAAILNTAGIDRASVNAGRISFGIVPRINAAGRMGSAMRAFNLLIGTDTLSSLKIANEIDDDNALRQQIEREIYDWAINTIEKNGYQYDCVIVVEGDNWHSGVIGIVASRICEKYGKPAIVLSVEEEMAHGSGRSFAGFHLYNAINSCADILVKYGGHELAAGVSLQPQNIGDFRKAINEYAQSAPTAIPELKLDFKINPKGMSVDMVYALKALEPFGAGNPSPLFGIFGVKLEKLTAIGSGKHLKLMFSKDDAAFQAVLFGVTPEQFCFCVGDELDLAVSLDANLFREEYTLSVQIKALRMSGFDDETAFESKSQFENFMAGRDFDTAALLPSREQVGAVYKKITQGEISLERIRHIFLNTIGYAKTQIAIKVLHELGLVSFRGGKLCGGNNSAKTDLMNSVTYRAMTERGNINE